MAATERLKVVIDTLFHGRGAKEANRELGKLETTTKKTGRSLRAAGTAFAAVSAGALAAGFAIKKTWEIIGQGAALELARSQFDNLAVSIGTTSDAMLREFAAATGGMMSNAEMIASASQIISLGLADTEADVVRLGNVVGQLGWDMNQVILTLANNSKMRLDALGLSIEDVDKRTQAFIAQGHNMDKAFDLAVIEAGEAKIRLLGSAVDTTEGAMKILSATVKDNTDSAKVWVSEGVGPMIQELARLVVAHKKAQDILKSEDQQLNTAIQDSWMYAEALRDVNRELDQWYDSELNRQQAMTLTLERLGLSQDASLKRWVEMGRIYVDLVPIVEDLGEAHVNTGVDLQYMAKVARLDVPDAASRTEDAMRAAQVSADDLSSSVLAAAASMTNFNGVTGLLNIESISKDTDLLVHAFDTLGTSVFHTSGLTEDQTAGLDELESSYDRIDGRIASLKWGTAGLNLTQEELTEALENEAEQLGIVSGKIETLKNVEGTTSVVTHETAFATDELTRALLESAEAQDAGALSVSLLMAATGDYGDEQIEAAVKTAVMRAAIEEMAGKVADGTLTVQGAIDAVQNLATDMALLDGTQAILDVTINTHGTFPSVPAEYQRGDEFIVTAEPGSSIPGRAHGGSANRNRPYLVGENGPEVIVPSTASTVIPNNEIGGTTVIFNNYAPMLTDPRAFVGKVSQLMAPRG